MNCTEIPASAHVKRTLISVRCQLFNKKAKGSKPDKIIEMTLLLKCNKYFD